RALARVQTRDRPLQTPHEVEQTPDRAMQTPLGPSAVAPASDADALRTLCKRPIERCRRPSDPLQTPDVPRDPLSGCIPRCPLAPVRCSVGPKPTAPPRRI